SAASLTIVAPAGTCVEGRPPKRTGTAFPPGRRTLTAPRVKGSPDSLDKRSRMLPPSAPTRAAKRTVAFSIATSCFSFAASHMLADQAGVHSPFAGAAATSNKALATTIGFQGRRILHSHAVDFPVKAR